jgi:hypothetical protein
MTINAGGGDWLDLPTTPIQHRGARKPEGLPWDRINEAYVASGGQVDAGVWPKHNGKVQVVGNRALRHGIHTFVEGAGYSEPAALKRAARPKKTATASKPREVKVKPEDRAEIARRYEAGESITALGKAYGVNDGSIGYAIRKMGVETRSRAEAWRMRREQGAS